MKTIFKVEQSDLVGDIKDFPIEVVEKMIEEQVKQGNQPNVEVFQHYISAGDSNNGFDWSSTDEGYDFWEDVIRESNFGLSMAHTMRLPPPKKKFGPRCGASWTSTAMMAALSSTAVSSSTPATAGTVSMR